MFSVCIQFHSSENPGDKIHKSSQPAAPPPHSDRKKEEKKQGKKRGKRGEKEHIWETKIDVTDEEIHQKKKIE